MDNNLRMEESSSPFTPENESFLAVATGKRTEMDDITMSSLPGTPIAASTVMRQKGNMEQRQAANHKNSRGSLFGSDDPLVYDSKSRSKDSPHFSLNPENIAEESPADEKVTENPPKDKFLASIEEDSSDNVEEFLRTHNVSGLLQKISLSQTSLSDKPVEARESLMSQTSDTSLGILNLDSMQDISAGITECSNLPEGNSFGEKMRSQRSGGSGSSRNLSEAEMNRLTQDSSKTSEKTDFRGQNKLDAAVSKSNRPGTELKFGRNNEKEFETQELSRRETDYHREDESGAKYDTGDNSETLKGNLKQVGDQAVESSQSRQRNKSSMDGLGGVKSGLMGRGKVDQGGQMTGEKDAHCKRQRMDCSNEPWENRPFLQNPGPSVKQNELLHERHGHAGGSRDYSISGQIASLSDSGVRMSDNGRLPSEEMLTGTSNVRQFVNPDPAEMSQRTPVNRGLNLIIPEENDDDFEIDKASLQAGLDQLDALFFDPSPTSKSQRSGSGDGEESRSPSLPPSPQISRNDWQGAQRFPQDRLTGQHLRTESQITGESIDFDDMEDQGNFLQDAFDDIRYPGQDEDLQSEIDTEDEIEAARKELQLEMNGDERPGIEGGSSGEDDQPPPISNLEPRQSAEGVVVISPVPGDGGGGGDGMSDGESDSGTSMGERSPIRNGISGTERSHDGDGNLDSDEERDSSGGRDIEGQTRSQPVGDGIVMDNASSGRQVRFASHDDVTRWTPSGSAFHSRLRRSRNSGLENGDDSLFPSGSATPLPTQGDDPSLLSSQFLQPSRASVDNHGTEGRNQKGDSLLFSQESSHLSQQSVNGASSGGWPPAQEMEFERTLTPGASDSDELLQVRASSMGSFGLPPTGGDADITFTQRVSFGEDFSLLEAVGSSGSDSSSKRHSIGTDGSSSREDSRPARGDSIGRSHHSRGSQVVYFDEEGNGLTDLAYRTSLPMMHKLGNVNPFESFDNQEELEQDIMKNIDFGIEANEEFLSTDQAAAVLKADESAFLEENIFHKDENMSAEASKDPSDWTVNDKSHVTIQDNITGSEDFCRISLGTFFGKRTEALGSLSGSSDTSRPTFGCGDLVSPPAREPKAIVNMSDQRHGSDVSQDQSPSYDKRQDGEGGGNEGDGHSVKTSDERDSTLRENEKTFREDSEQHDEEETEIQEEEEFTKSTKKGPESEVKGTETPPLNLSDIAGVIGELSSKANSEEILQKIIALSNKKSVSRQGKPDRGKEMRVKENGRGASYHQQQSMVNQKDGQLVRKVSRMGGSKDGESTRTVQSVIDQDTVAQEREQVLYGGKDSSQRLRQNKFSSSSTQPNSSGSMRKGTEGKSAGSSDNADEMKNVFQMTNERMPDGDVSQTDYQMQRTRVSSHGNREKNKRDSDYIQGMEDVRKAGSERKANIERKVNREGRVANGAALNNSQNGSHLSQTAPDVGLKYSNERTGNRSINRAGSDIGPLKHNGGKNGESEGPELEEIEASNWATSSSIHRNSSLSLKRGFFKSSRNVEREILVLSPKNYEMEKDHSSEEEEEISPIFGAEMDLGRTGPIPSMQYDHQPALLREESEPDGEPNLAGLAGVVNIPVVSQSVSSSKVQSNIPGTNSKDSRGRDKQPIEGRGSLLPGLNTDSNHKGLDSQPSNPSLQSSSRESVDGQGMIVVGRHTVKQLSRSMLVHSFNDTLQPSFIRDPSPKGSQKTPSLPQQVNKSDPKVATLPEGTSSQDGITSSSLSSEEEAVRISPSPPGSKASSKILEQEERYNQGLPLSTSTHLGGSRPTSSLQARSGMDGEEAKEKDIMAGRSKISEIIEKQGENHVSAMNYGKYNSLNQGQKHDTNLVRHGASSLPTLLTSQSLLDPHLTTSQIINSRPGSSLSADVLDTHLSGHSVDSYHLSGGSGASSSHLRLGSSSHSYLGDTLTNLGRRPHLLSEHLPTSNYQDHVRPGQTGLPHQTHWQRSQDTSQSTILGNGMSSFPPPLFTHAPLESLPIRHLPPNIAESHHRPPIMSVDIAPNGEPQLPASRDANLVLPSSLGMTHNLENHHFGYTHHSLPVSSGLGDTLPGSRRSNTFGELDLQGEYFRGHRDTPSSTLVLPAHVRFKGVCCVGIASHHSLPLHNSSSRWLHCFLDVVQVTANGEEVPPEGHSTFITKERTTIAPQGTEQVKIIFVPKHPGIYTALLHVGWSTVVPDRDRGTPHEPPQVVRLQALAEHPNVEVLESKDFHFGEMVYGSAKSKAFHVVNRGRCTVPVRLLLTCTPASLSCFSLSTGDKKSEAVTLSPRGTPASTISPIHISLKGRPDTDSDDDLSTASTVWINFRAPPQLKEADKMQEAENFSAQMDVELDVPEKILTLQSIKLSAVVGVARLHIPRKMNIVNFSATVGKEDCRMLPMKNSGAIKLDITFSVSRAEDLFSVSPKSLSLKPGEQTSVEIKYAPKEAPSAVESLLIMKTYDDGPKFDMVMRGEGVVAERKTSKDTPTLFSNKQFVSWGGVAVGRALQQKIVLRNSSSSIPLKLKVSLMGGGSDFQLQSSFGSQMQLSETKSLILKPEEDLPVNILFAPTSVTISQGQLVMKPLGGCTKYTVPLSGYGGISSLSIDELQKVGETSVLPIGNVKSGERKVFTLKISNHGDRAAFVKILCFNNLKAKLKLLKTHLSVEPQEFVLPAKGVEQLTVVYQPVERDAALCYYQSSMVAAVGVYSGDEIMRIQYRKALRLGHAQDVELSPDNPLNGVLFDKTFLREKQTAEESSLPSRSNDIQLFYSCMSKMMLALVGDSAASSNNSDVVNGIMGNNDNVEINGAISSYSHINRSDQGLSSPPVKGTPAQGHGPSLRLSSYGPSGPWTLYPEYLILTWTSDSGRSESTGRIHISNNTERELSFELVWPGHCLTVTPQNGVVQPNDQRVLLVSANPSIHSKGVSLPWSGSVYVSCDNLEKEVRVQIREDLALDTSVLPTSSKQLHSLSHEPSTPAVMRRVPPTEKSSPKELRVKSKVIKCEDAIVGQKTVFIFEFENTKQYPMKWNLSSFAPAYLKQPDGTVCRTTYSVFRFESTSGEMTPGQKMQLSLHFMPREEGDYSQFWDLESSSTTNLVSHKTRIELSGHGIPKSGSSHSDQLSKNVPKQNLYRQALSKHQRHSGSKALDFSKVTKSVTSHHPSGSTKVADTSGTKMIPQRLKETSKKSSIVVNDFVNFGRCEANQHQTVMVRLKNCATNPQKVKFVSPPKPFSIKHHEHMIKARHYLKLPVTFHPTTKGQFQSPLIIETENQERLAVKLIGECI